MGIMRTTKATRTKTKTRTRSNVQECDGVVVVCNELSTQNEDEDVDEDDEGNENGDKNGERSARMRSRCATARTCCRWLPSPRHQRDDRPCLVYLHVVSLARTCCSISVTIGSRRARTSEYDSPAGQRSCSACRCHAV